MKERNLIYALQKNQLVHVSDVERGLSCNCICPSCGARLVARKGDKRMHHFAHYQSDNCEDGYETSLHLAAKEILLHAQKMIIPSVFIEFPSRKVLLNESREIHIDKVELEKRFEDVIPDIVIYSGGKQLYVEIYVTHPVDDVKLKKIQNQGVSTLEIDLSKIDCDITTQELTALLLDDCPEKTWKYNTYKERWLKKFKSVSREHQIISRGYAFHVDDCPIRAREWRGKFYANFIDDCSCCDYLIQYDDEKIWCSGEERISTKEDFGKEREERIKDHNERLEGDRFERFENGLCPNCGNYLTLRNGQYGLFIGCQSYPHCRYCAQISNVSGLAIYVSRFGQKVECSIPYAIAKRQKYYE